MSQIVFPNYNSQISGSVPNLVPGHKYKIRLEYIEDNDHVVVEYESKCQICVQTAVEFYSIILCNPNYDTTTGTYYPDFALVQYYPSDWDNIEAYSNLNINILVTITEIKPLGVEPTPSEVWVVWLDNFAVQQMTTTEAIMALWDAMTNALNEGNPPSPMYIFPVEPIINSNK